MMDMKVQPGIMDIAPYVGGESDIDGAEEIIKLSSNEGAPALPRGLKPTPRCKANCIDIRMASARRCATPSARSTALIRRAWSVDRARMSSSACCASPMPAPAMRSSTANTGS